MIADPDRDPNRDREQMMLLRAGWPGAVIVIVFLVVATSRWWT